MTFDWRPWSRLKKFVLSLIGRPYFEAWVKMRKDEDGESVVEIGYDYNVQFLDWLDAQNDEWAAIKDPDLKVSEYVKSVALAAYPSDEEDE